MTVNEQAEGQAAGLSPGDWYRAAGWVLRVAVALYVVGIAVAVYTRTGTSLGGIALMEWGVPHDRIFLTERIAAAVLLVLGASLLVWPTAVAALLVGGAVFTESYAAYRFGGFPFYEWTVYATALRWLAPLALALLVVSPRVIANERWRALGAMWILRVALAVVFVTHGLEAWKGHPWFIDLLIGTSRRWLGFRLTESNAVLMLQMIGIVDLVVAGLILVGRWRILLGWLCFWATITALSRVTALGLASYPEVLVRSSHIAAPVAVWMLGRWQESAIAMGARAHLREGSGGQARTDEHGGALAGTSADRPAMG